MNLLKNIFYRRVLTHPISEPNSEGSFEQPSIKDVLNIYQTEFEKLVSIYSTADYYEEIKDARNKFLENWSNLVENDPNEEARIQQFLDSYIFERKLYNSNLAPIEHFLSLQKGFESSIHEEIFKSMLKTERSLFLVKKIKEGTLVVKDLFGKLSYVIQDCSFAFIFQPGLVLDGRLVPTKFGFLLSRGFCPHPIKASNFIRKKIRLILKSKDSLERKTEKKYELIKDLEKKYALCLSYKHVDVDKIYSNLALFEKNFL